MSTRILIDVRVPESMQTREDFISARRIMERFVTSPDQIQRCATHEAGHLVYFKRTRLISSLDDVTFRGPTIVALQDGRIRYFAALVKPSWLDPNDMSRDYDEEYLRRIAIAAVAGGAIERLLLGPNPGWESGDTGDLQLLRGYCNTATAKSRVAFDASSLWDSAQREVTDSVQRNREDIQAEVNNVRGVILERCFRM